LASAARKLRGLLDIKACFPITKIRARRYFTPRILIKSIVRCVKPDPRAYAEFTISDPACGSGGFLVAAYEWFIGETAGAMEKALAKRVWLKDESLDDGDGLPEPEELATDAIA
jgi:N-6 DNA Methylase